MLRLLSILRRWSCCLWFIVYCCVLYLWEVHGWSLFCIAVLIMFFLQWATVVSYAPRFQGQHFLTNMLGSNNLYMKFYLFDDIENILESLMWIILLRQRQFWQKCTCSLAAWTSIFSICVCARHYPCLSSWQKITKNLNYIIQVKPIFWLLNSVTLLLFKEMLGFDGIITSVTIMKQVVLRKLSCFESLFDIEVSKH